MGIEIHFLGVIQLCFSTVQDKRRYLDLISRFVDIHATVGTTQQKKNKGDMSVVPGYVTNHGILNSTALRSLLAVSGRGGRGTSQGVLIRGKKSTECNG